MAGIPQKVRLPREERDILERRGVIPTPLVPKLDTITEAAKARHWEVKFALDDEGKTVARVVAEGETFENAGDHEGLALTRAFCQALVATEPAQGSLPLFDASDDEEDDSYPEGDAESWGRTDEAEADEGDGMPFGFGPDEVEGSAAPESDVPETTETDERVEQWIRGGQNGAAETASGEMSAREFNLYQRHQTGIRTDDLAGTPRSTEKLLDRAQELERRLSSPAVRTRNVEDYRAELRAIREEITRRSAGTVVWDGSAPPDDFDAGGDELARKQGIVATLQAAGMEIDLVDGEYVEPATGVQIEEAYAEAEYQKALGDPTPATAG